MTEAEIEAAVEYAHFLLSIYQQHLPTSIDGRFTNQVVEWYCLLRRGWIAANPRRDLMADPEAAREWMVEQARSGNRMVRDALCCLAEHFTPGGRRLPISVTGFGARGGSTITDGTKYPKWVTELGERMKKTAGAADYTQDHSPPPWLLQYVVSAAREGPRSTKKRGRPGTNALRDQAITWVVLVVATRYHLNPTRNAEPRPHSTTESACSIVRRAFERLQIPMSESRLNDVWGAGDGSDLMAKLEALPADQRKAFGPNLWMGGAPPDADRDLEEIIIEGVLTGDIDWQPMVSGPAPGTVRRTKRKRTKRQ